MCGRISRPGLLSWPDDLRAVDEGTGQVGQAEVSGAGAVAQHGECLVHIEAEALGELALGLFDDDPVVQRDSKADSRPSGSFASVGSEPYAQNRPTAVGLTEPAVAPGT
jgi:hypothetical protein